MYCNKCGNMVEDNQQFCSKCGNRVDVAGGAPQAAPQQVQQPQQVVYAREKSEGLAAVLSLIWLGLGQIYDGKIGRGLGIMVVGIILVFVFWFLLWLIVIVMFIFWIWNIFDAYKLAKQYNDQLRSTGNRPW